MYKYNPEKNMWVSIDKLKQHSKGSQEGIVLNDKFYFISGQNNGHSLSEKAVKKIYSYNPKTNEYQESFNNLLIGRHYNYGVFGYKNSLYLLGGREDQEWKPMNNVIEIKLKN